MGVDGPASFNIDVLYKGLQNATPADVNGAWLGLDAARDLRNPDGSAPYTGRMPGARRDAIVTEKKIKANGKH